MASEVTQQDRKIAATIVNRCGIRDGLFKGARIGNAVETIASALAAERATVERELERGNVAKRQKLVSDAEWERLSPESRFCLNEYARETELLRADVATAELRGIERAVEAVERKYDDWWDLDRRRCIDQIVTTIRALSPDPLCKTKLEKDTWDAAIKIADGFIDAWDVVAALIAARDADTELK